MSLVGKTVAEELEDLIVFTDGSGYAYDRDQGCGFELTPEEVFEQRKLIETWTESKG